MMVVRVVTHLRHILEDSRSPSNSRTQCGTTAILSVRRTEPPQTQSRRINDASSSDAAGDTYWKIAAALRTAARCAEQQPYFQSEGRSVTRCNPSATMKAVRVMSDAALAAQPAQTMKPPQTQSLGNDEGRSSDTRCGFNRTNSAKRLQKTWHLR